VVPAYLPGSIVTRLLPSNKSEKKFIAGGEDLIETVARKYNLNSSDKDSISLAAGLFGGFCNLAAVSFCFYWPFRFMLVRIYMFIIPYYPAGRF